MGTFITNGKIVDSSIYTDDNDNLVIMLRIKEQGFTTPYYISYSSGDCSIKVAMLRSLLHTVGVSDFESLKGQYVRVETNGLTGAAGKILKNWPYYGRTLVLIR